MSDRINDEQESNEHKVESQRPKCRQQLKHKLQAAGEGRPATKTHVHASYLDDPRNDATKLVDAQSNTHECSPNIFLAPTTSSPSAASLAGTTPCPHHHAASAALHAALPALASAAKARMRRRCTRRHAHEPERRSAACPPPPEAPRASAPLRANPP